MSTRTSPPAHTEHAVLLDGQPVDRRKWEIGVFLAVVAVIIPLITFFSIALYALIVWIFQMLIFGPPGPVY